MSTDLPPATPSLDAWFEELRRDPNVIKMGRTVGAQFGLDAIDSVTAVVDTNVVLVELMYLARRPGPVVRASIPGLAHSGVLRPICPHQLGTEIDKHLPRFAARARVELSEMRAIWGEYRAYLRFVEVVPVHTPAITYVEQRDPKDVDFVHVQESFGIDVILTQDNDLKDSPAPTADDPKAVLMALRVYEREKRYKFALVVGGWTFAMSGSMSVIAIAKTLKLLWQGFVRLPWWVQLGIGAAAAYGLTRLKREQIDTFLSWCKPLIINLAHEALAQASVAHQAEERATVALTAARALVPMPKGRRKLLPTIRRALLDHPAGLSTGELAAAVVALGYKTKALDLPAFLERTLRRERGIVCHDGKWRLNGLPSGPLTQMSSRPTTAP